MKYLSALAAAFLCAACSTVTTGTSQSIAITTPDAEGAKCELTDSKGGKWYANDTPSSITVRKGDGPMSIVCKKPGYKTATVMADEEVVGATFGNIILGGGIGIFVDAASGAAQKYPDQISVFMEPDVWPSQEAKADWEKRKSEYEKMLAEKAEAQKKGATPPARRLR